MIYLGASIGIEKILVEVNPLVYSIQQEGGFNSN